MKRNPFPKIQGFTVIELLISLAVNVVLLGAVFIFFMNQNKTVTGHEQIMRVQQNAKNAVRNISNDLMMIGYNPKRYAFTAISGSAGEVRFRQYTAPSFTGHRVTTIVFDENARTLSRIVNGNTRPIAGNIKRAEFRYYNQGGVEMPLPIKKATSADVRQVSISLTTVTKQNRAGFSNFTTVTFTERVTPPNLGYE